MAHSMHVTDRNIHKPVVKPEEKISLQKPRHRWQHNTKIYFKQILSEGVD